MGCSSLSLRLLGTLGGVLQGLQRRPESVEVPDAKAPHCCRLQRPTAGGGPFWPQRSRPW